jgi:IS605 OrfB family transposase
VRSDNYSTFVLKNKAFIKIPSLQKGKRIAIPLNTTEAPTGTLRIILRNDRVEVHYSIEVKEKKDCGESEIAVDKGYSEVFVDSEGEHHGEELGDRLAAESDYLKEKYTRRHKLRSISRKKAHKKKKIYQNNLGRKKLNRRKAKTTKQVEDIIYKATHAVVDKAKTVVSEDLTAPMSSKKRRKDVTRRLSAWTKGLIAKALEYVSQRRGSTLVLVNAAYTSQMDSRTGTLLGQRKGDSFYCFDGEVLHADENAARNIQARLYDTEISRWTPYQKVKSILLERTERLRLGLLNQDSSCSNSLLSTESELPNGQLCPTF